MRDINSLCGLVQYSATSKVEIRFLSLEPGKNAVQENLFTLHHWRARTVPNPALFRSQSR